MGLYIHVPFCGSICSYCHFARTAEHDRGSREAYVDSLLREFQMRSETCGILAKGKRPLASAYLGGGTPSLLEPELMQRLVAGTVDTFTTSPDFEFTAEANPESLDDARAEAWRELGINRISLGVQSLRPEVLQLLGRECAPDEARRAMRLACRRFERVTADWILGPALQVETLCDELTEAIDLGIEHFSLYILEVHAGTRLQQDVLAGRLQLPRDEETERVYLAAGEHLERAGFVQYEVANFARSGAESRHNQSYWTGSPYLGLGPGAHGFWGRRRYANEFDVAAWSAAIESGRLPEAEVDVLNRASRRLERVILSLRTARGVPLAWIPAGALEIERGRESGWWNICDGRLVLTRSGFLRIDAFEEALAARILD